MLWPCSSEIDDGLSLAGQYAGRGTYRESVDASVGQHERRVVFIERQSRHGADES